MRWKRSEICLEGKHFFVEDGCHTTCALAKVLFDNFVLENETWIVRTKIWHKLHKFVKESPTHPMFKAKMQLE